MKVAIIGAGLAGLSCAHELEKHNIHPVIYERNGFIGEQNPHVAALLEIITRPIKDPIKYFSKQLDIRIKPLNTLNTLVHYSPNKTTIIKGNLGYLIKRDRENDDIKNQIYSSLKNTTVLFNQLGDYRTLSKEYDSVVIANGDSNFTEELGCWNERVSTFLRGAIVLGDFDPNTLIVWLNKDYCKNGYAYLTPFDNKQASLALIVTDVNEKEIDQYWDLFIKAENLRYAITEEFKFKHKSANVYPYKVDNIYLAGDSAGIIDPFLGFGQLSSVTMGVMAGRSIAEGKDYEKLVRNITKKNIKLLEFRKALNGATNLDYDLLIASIGIPGIKHLAYYTPLNVVNIGAFAIKHLPLKKKV